VIAISINKGDIMNNKVFKKISLALLAVFILFCNGIVQLNAGENTKICSDIKEISWSAFPILMYDSDIGLGFGGRGIIKNLFKADESFDLILFASTLGEQWYAFTFSIPDFEIRQGTAYSIAFDLKFEFDKYLKSNYFGIGNETPDNEWQFPSELFKLELILGTAFTEQLIGEISLVLQHRSIYDYEEINPLLVSEEGTGEKMVNYIRLHARLDTRDTQIHPRRGMKIGINADFASEFLGSDFTFQRYRIEFSNYLRLFGEDHILAARLWLQHVDGKAPYYEQSILGDGWTARGFKMDRFVDKAMVLISLEYRFPILGDLGGVLFLDTGRVLPGIDEFTLDDWRSDVGWGLRYYLENFVVRFDMGFSEEGERIFFNFGHVF
jgi:outer membrane protein assembly factor BamA